MVTNKYGLSREIPAAIKRQVRQECGFGCVICGFAIVQYEHVDPVFADAREHKPESIALLCGSCHDRVTRGYWSKQLVKRARENPITFIHGFCHDILDVSAPFRLAIGDNIFTNINCILRNNNGDEWFSIAPPEEVGGPPRLNVKFFTGNGNPALFIDSNEWRCFSGVWDLVTAGNTLVVREHKQTILLKIKITPPHELQLMYLKMRTLNTEIEVGNDASLRIWNSGVCIRMKLNDVINADSIITIP